MTKLKRQPFEATTLTVAWPDEPAVDIPVRVQVLPHSPAGLGATLHLLQPDTASVVRQSGDTSLIPRGV